MERRNGTLKREALLLMRQALALLVQADAQMSACRLQHAIDSVARGTRRGDPHSTR